MKPRPILVYPGDFDKDQLQAVLFLDAQDTTLEFRKVHKWACAAYTVSHCGALGLALGYLLGNVIRAPESPDVVEALGSLFLAYLLSHLLLRGYLMREAWRTGYVLDPTTELVTLVPPVDHQE